MPPLPTPLFQMTTQVLKLRRRNLTRRYPLGSLPPRFLLASTRAIPFVPPFVFDLSAGGLRRWPVALLLFAGGTSRPTGFYPLSGPCAHAGMGGLRRATFRWPAAGSGLRRSLDPPSCYFQSSDRGYRRRAGEISLAGGSCLASFQSNPRSKRKLS